MKGSDCLEQFRAMQECLQRYPELYPQEDETSTQTSQDSASVEPSDADSTPASEQDSDAAEPSTESAAGS